MVSSIPGGSYPYLDAAAAAAAHDLKIYLLQA